MFLHLEIEKSETLEIPLATNQGELPASLGLSTTALPLQKLRDPLGRIVPEEVVKSKLTL